MDWDHITPDFVFFGKTFAAGYAPISALMTSEDVANLLSKKDSKIQFSTTFQGHSLACSAALAVVELIRANDWVNNARVQGDWMREFLESHLMELSSYSNVRGRGVRCSLENQARIHTYSAWSLGIV